MAAVPCRHLADRLAEHPPSDRHDEARFLCNRDEFGRLDVAPLRMPPPGQRLEADDFERVERQNRLVLQVEGVGGERLLHVHFECEPRQRSRAHGRVELHASGARERFRSEQGGIGLLQHIYHSPAFVIDRQSDAGR